MAIPSRREARSPNLVLFWALALVLVALRIPHFTGPLDDPNSWRQVDTAHNSLDFCERGLDLLHPAVPWLGAHRTLALDFPITPALSSLLYRLFGPSVVFDRFVSLAFFLLSAYHLHGIARFVAGGRVARLSTLAYLVFPLGVFYSRAPHIEFTVIAGVNGFLHHALRSFEEPGRRQPLLAAAWGTLACLVKAPYLATVLPPLGLALLGAGALLPWGKVALALIPGTLAFLAWRHHADAVNATVPDWTFLPDFYKEVNPLWRYVGTMAERTDMQNWIRILRRVLGEVFTYGGALLAAFAMFNGGSRNQLRDVPERKPGEPGLALAPRVFAIAWALGAAAHVLLFFRLNYIHNYYQTPLLAPAALWVGLGADALFRKVPRPGGVPLAALLFAGFLAWAAWFPSKLGYYRVDWLREASASLLESLVPAGDLVIASDHNTLPPTDPRLLGRAHREGWPMRWNEITPWRVAKLREFGAKWVVIVTSPENPEMRVPGFLEPVRVATGPVLQGEQTIGTLHLFELARFGPRWSPPPSPADLRPRSSDPGEVWQHPPEEGGGP